MLIILGFAVLSALLVLLILSVLFPRFTRGLVLILLAFFYVFICVVFAYHP